MSNLMNENNRIYFEYAYKYIQRFMSVTPAEMADLLNYCEFRTFDKKKIVVNEGDIDNYLNMVIKGMMRKYIKVGKNDMILQLATEGHVIHSEISFITRQPSIVIVETMEPTVLISLAHEKMNEALDKFPFGEKLARLILFGMYIKKDESRYNRLSKSTQERFIEYMEQHPHMLQRVPQKYLASYLNIKPETFSRLKALMYKRKV